MVIGAGVIGLEYATIFAALGMRVTVVDKRPRLLGFVDHEIIDTLVYQMRQNRITLRLGEEVAGLERFSDGLGEKVRIKLASGKQIQAHAALYSIGRTGATGDLGLDEIGLETGERGLITVDEQFRTSLPHIFAASDVIGFPSLASTSMEQGRIACCHAFGAPAENTPDLLPYSIYTIPEISIVGRSEEELTDAGVPYEVGRASYNEIRWSQILGDSVGILNATLPPGDPRVAGCRHPGGRGPRSSSTSARRSSASAARSTTSSTRCSTIRRWPNATRRRPSTG